MAAKKGRSTEQHTSNFTWTDDELSLLLHVIMDYKTEKSSLGVDWDTVKAKYDNILDKFIENYPKVKNEAYPNSDTLTSVFTKERIIAKIKRIKLCFRKAIDSGRRSGGGKVVTVLYDECCEIWSGSPAVIAIPNGLESSRDDSVNSDSEISEASALQSNLIGDIEDDSNSKHSSDVSLANGKSGERRNLIKTLKEKRDGKLTKKISC